MKLENLYKHPFSTIVGLCLVIYALAGLWVGKFDYTVAGPILFAGLYGLGKKDAQGPADGGVSIVLILLSTLALAVGCRNVRTNSKEVSKDSVSINVKNRLQPVTVEGAALTFDALLKCDSLGNVKWNEGWRAAFDQLHEEPQWNFENSYAKQPDVDKNTVVVKDKNGAFASLHLDSATGKLTVRAGCDSLMRVVHAQDSTIKLMHFRSLFKEEATEVQVTPWWNWLLFGILISIILYLRFNNLLKWF